MTRPDLSAPFIRNRILPSYFSFSDYKLRPLPSERDQNIHVICNGQQYVLKISNSQENLVSLEFQNEILHHVRKSSEFDVPILIKSIIGTEVVTVSDGKNKYFVRLLSYVEGQLFSNYSPKTKSFFVAFGKFLAELTVSFQNIQENTNINAMDSEFKWDIRHASKTIRQYKAYIHETNKLDILAYFEQLFVQKIKLVKDKLEFQMIHNDANDYNVLVKENTIHYQEKDQKTAKNIRFGIIDFGDIVYTWKIIDLAVGIAYAILKQDDIKKIVLYILEGYCQETPLTSAEKEILFPLIGIRLCVSVCISAYQQTQDPKNEYLTITEQDAWTALEKLRKINPTIIQVHLENQLQNFSINERRIKVSIFLKDLKHYIGLINQKNIIFLLESDNKERQSVPLFVIGPHSILGEVFGLIDEEYGWPIPVKVDEVKSVEHLRPKYRKNPVLVDEQGNIAIVISLIEYKQLLTKKSFK